MTKKNKSLIQKPLDSEKDLLLKEIEEKTKKDLKEHNQAIENQDTDCCFCIEYYKRD